MDYMQALVSFFIAPLFGTVILGMMWKRGTAKGGFWGLLCGTLVSVGMYTGVVLHPEWLRYVALSPDAKPMAENLYRALWSWVVCVVVTVVVSLFTKPKTADELRGLVRAYTVIPNDRNLPLHKRPIFWGAGVALLFVVLQVVFW
jgi:SSS family solute:Na+ symporter